MDALLKTILEAPLPNVLIFGGLIFVGLSVLGGISGKLEPGKQGRIAAGIIGTLLLVLGIYLSVSSAGIPQAARTVATSPLDAPLPNLLIVAGLLFVGVGVLGGISGKFEPDRQGRIAAGAVGSLLLLIGFVMVFSSLNSAQAARALTPSPAPSSVAALQASVTPSAAPPSVTPIQTLAPSAAPAVAASATPLPTSATQPAAAPTTAPVNVFVPRRETNMTALAAGGLISDERWTVQFGPRAVRSFGLSLTTGGADRSFEGITVGEGDVAYSESGARQADHTFEVVSTPSSDGGKRLAVTWYFPLSSNLTRTFSFHYIWHAPLVVTADGIVLLRWRVHSSRPWAIGSERVALMLPQAVDPARIFAMSLWTGADGPAARVLDGQTIEFTGQDIAPDATWDIQVRYPQP